MSAVIELGQTELEGFVVCLLKQGLVNLLGSG